MTISKKISDLSLLKRGYFRTTSDFDIVDSPLTNETITVLNNLAYYGYTLSKDLTLLINSFNKKELESFYDKILPHIKTITGDDLNMGNFVVYKNFPKEVLEMNESDYFIRQLLIYFGFDYNLVNQEAEPREKLTDSAFSQLKVIEIAPQDIDEKIQQELLKANSAWSEDQFIIAQELDLAYSKNNLSDYAFKDNGLRIFTNNYLLYVNTRFVIQDASHVLRLFKMISKEQGNKSLFPKLKRKDRKEILSMLDNTNHIEEDVMLNKKEWKIFLKLLHPYEYKNTKISKLLDDLLNNNLSSFNKSYELMLSKSDEQIFSLLSSRVGHFSNNLFKLYQVFGQKALKEFSKVIKKVDVKKLLKLKVFFKNINQRENTIFFPKNGKYRPVFVRYTDTPNKNLIEQSISLNKTKVKIKDVDFIIDAINNELKTRLQKALGFEHLEVSQHLKNIKLKNKDNSLNDFGEGTVFNIPKNIKFIRTASFWSKTNAHGYWLDNSINFFNDNLEHLKACCWTSEKVKDLRHGVYSVFSGDPLITEENNKACQMIDIDIDKALKSNVRYAVFTILSYNKVSISDFNEAFANIQYLEEPQKGELFEPSLSQYHYSLKHIQEKTNALCIFDLKERKIIFLDKNLHLNVHTAEDNSGILSKFLKYYIRELDNQPSVYDLLEPLHKKGGFSCYFDEKGLSYISNNKEKEGESEEAQRNIISLNDLLS